MEVERTERGVLCTYQVRIDRQRLACGRRKREGRRAGGARVESRRKGRPATDAMIMKRALVVLRRLGSLSFPLIALVPLPTSLSFFAHITLHALPFPTAATSLITLHTLCSKPQSFLPSHPIISTPPPTPAHPRPDYPSSPPPTHLRCPLATPSSPCPPPTPTPVPLPPLCR